MLARKDALLGGVLGAVAALAIPSVALAHLERPSYWPDPAPDTSVSPPAGGEVPTPRSLASAVTGKGPGDVNVVCKGTDGRKSLRALRKSLRNAQRKGFRLRPSQPKIHYGGKRARKLRRINRALAEQCEYHLIQEAVFDSGNNDRVVIMPGRYKEKRSRRQPTNDPACADLTQESANGATTPSYEYQSTCPNDQNLIMVQGREAVGEPLEPPSDNRQGIPEQELGDCVRCNVQIEGSGVKPEDVILDAGRNYIDPRKPTSKPGGGAGCEDPGHCYTNHIVLRADRADGFVGRNFLTKGALEFGFYSEETDGVLLDRVKFFWTADYGHLTFTVDHHVLKNCDGFGAGDAVLYPGGAPETGEQADTSFYPDAPRINTVVRKCDMRGSALGYSGSMGNAVRITQSHIYGNTTGIASDTFSSAGHPGFPADSTKIDNNLIYSNNLDLYSDDPPVEPVVGVPIGTGIIYAGLNNARVHDNFFFDNWRDGAMLFAVPDALTGGGGPEGNVNPGISCPGAPTNGISTSCGNEYFDNSMGVAPPGFRFPKALDQFGAAHGALGGPLPNGNDFWWDEFFTNTDNCWYDNTGPDGTPGSVTGPGSPTALPGVPGKPLCNALPGQGNPAKELYLLDCADGPDEDTGPLDCDWWRTPDQPNSGAARAAQRRFQRAAAKFEASPEGAALRDRMEALGR